MGSPKTIKLVDYGNEMLSNLENEMINEKLNQGVNGVEWLVSMAFTDVEGLYDLWIRKLNLVKAKDVGQVVIDNLLLDPYVFYDKYELNWWISLDYAIYYLQMLKERNYDEYFNLLQRYEEQAKKVRK